MLLTFLSYENQSLLLTELDQGASPPSAKSLILLRDFVFEPSIRPGKGWTTETTWSNSFSLLCIRKMVLESPQAFAYRMVEAWTEIVTKPTQITL